MLKITGIFIDGGRIRTDRGTDRFRYATIDTERPVFSWAADSGMTDNAQTACRVSVTDPDGCLLWDSGWTEQREQAIKWGGDKLPHGIPLTLTVTLRDRYGEQSEPYAAPFVSGLLDEDEIRGSWITSGETPGGS